MSILEKIDKFLIDEEITTGDVAKNVTKGNVDVVGGECPEGQEWCPMEKKCKPIENEAKKCKKKKDIEEEEDGKRPYTFHRSTDGRKRRKSKG